MVRVLVMDDDPAIRSWLRTVLEDQHYEVLEAPDGKVGLRLFQERPPDVVILDVLMPEKEGIETLLELRKECPEVKVIMISGGSFRVTTQEALSAAGDFGALRTLAKPFSCEDLLDAIAAVLSLSGEQTLRSLLL